jgi:FkbM family methyltransferase
MSLQDLLRGSVNLVPWRVRDWIRKVPFVAGTQRWLLARFVGQEPFLHEINAGPAKGLRLMISMPADKGFWTGTYESHFVGAVAAAVKPGFVCFDIGGFHGFVSGVMALAGARQVECFEPLPGNLDVIRNLVELNPALPIAIRNCALGAANGQAHFTVMTEDSMGKLESSPYQMGESGRTSIAVTIRTLDALLADGDIVPPNLIKIDVEGAEYDVLQGGRQLLAKHHPEIFAEIHSPELRVRCESLLRELNYNITEVARTGASARPSAGISHVHATARARGDTNGEDVGFATGARPSVRNTARAIVKATLRKAVGLTMETLLFMRSRPLDAREPGRTLVISPHPDDECLGCGALLARLAHDDLDSVHVVYVTDGSKSHPSHPSLSAADLARERREEAQAALAVLGVTWSNAHYLNLEDGSLAHLNDTSRQNLDDRLCGIFEKVRPSRILLPLRFDGSSEHDASFEHVTRALRQHKEPVRLLEFPVWAAWRPHLLAKSLSRARVVHRFGARPWLRQKENALRCHRSQLLAMPPWPQPAVSPEFVSYFLRPNEYYFEFA